MVGETGVGDSGLANKAGGPGGAGAGAAGGAGPYEVPLGRVQANRHRELQVARTGGRKLFDEAARAVFLEWFGATCNLSLSASQAGFCYKTVSKHYLKDPGFAARMDEAMRLGVMRLKAKSLETKGPPVVGPDGELDAPDIEIGREEAMRLVREHERTLTLGRKQGRTPRVASNAEVEAALVKRLAAFAARQRGKGVGTGGSGGEADGPAPSTPPPPFGWSPSPSRDGEAGS